MIKAAWYKGVGTRVPINDDLDVAVAWTVGGVRYNISYLNTCARSGCIDFDNYNKNVSFETVSWNTSAPDPAVYDVCVKWSFTATTNYTVVLTVTRSGVTVLTASRFWMGTQSAAELSQCTATAVGWVGRYTAPAAPRPPSPAPKPPPSPWPPSPAPPAVDAFRVQVDYLRSGAPSTADFDIFVAWFDSTGVHKIDYFTGTDAAEQGGKYSGDNAARNASNEYAYWPAGGVSPPAVTYYVCVQWGSWTSPTASYTVMLRAWRSGTLIGGRNLTVNTAQAWNATCSPGSNSYVGLVDLTALPLVVGYSLSSTSSGTSASASAGTSVGSLDGGTLVAAAKENRMEAPSEPVAAEPAPRPDGGGAALGEVVATPVVAEEGRAGRQQAGDAAAGAAAGQAEADGADAQATPAKSIIAPVVGTIVGVLAAAVAAFAVVRWRQAKAAGGRILPDGPGGAPPSGGPAAAPEARAQQPNAAPAATGPTRLRALLEPRDDGEPLGVPRRRSANGRVSGSGSGRVSSSGVRAGPRIRP
ncbi:hypothetical protein HYH03_001448 [Edaphochlamys debaryana]|uniref:Uncharacterized protein n=1 Tax=Edaphochlamys debaryana TaxID=47281 RepID=A0A836C6G4_9CHLO|nr:hypothetical protein HYH03_001448 [Edaphochlamys debaryana]|eukprot:KAG2500682.1 hypothetical protein HYH03_001448 [Edaphochlamys debaryana]